MRSIAFSILLLSAAAAASAQQWEVGVLGGGQFLGTVNASGAPGNASAGFATGAAAGVFVGNNLYRNLGGEIRYEFLQTDLKLTSSGQSAQFAGQTHALHYDITYRTSLKESPVQFFAALGGGMKLFRATGAEEAYQPLSQFGYFTKTQQMEPMISAGGGLTFRLSKHVFLRAEVHDFISPFPKKVLTPAPGVNFGSILQNVVPMVGVSWVY